MGFLNLLFFGYLLIGAFYCFGYISHSKDIWFHVKELAKSYEKEDPEFQFRKTYGLLRLFFVSHLISNSFKYPIAWPFMKHWPMKENKKLKETIAHKEAQDFMDTFVKQFKNVYF